MKVPNLFTSIAMLLAVAFTFTADANAQQTYEILFEQSSYDVNAGSTIDVDVFLRETVSGGSIARLATGNDDGLFGFAFNADFGTAVGGAGSSVASATDVAINAIFDDAGATDAVIVGSSVDVIGTSTNTSPGIEVAPVSAGVYQVQLATLTITAGDEGSVTTFSLADHINNGDTVFTDFFTADPVLTFGAADVTVIAAVPEPASATILLGLCGAGLMRRRKR